jgi:hypothetical protein
LMFNICTCLTASFKAIKCTICIIVWLGAHRANQCAKQALFQIFVSRTKSNKEKLNTDLESSLVLCLRTAPSGSLYFYCSSFMNGEVWNLNLMLYICLTGGFRAIKCIICEENAIPKES